ncbi:MAG: DUF916 domain-containing protein [Defluviitaleaceae bacterium]|nr:DUF916 domain-containing protein [Defluviitaleaceae bacterium]
MGRITRIITISVLVFLATTFATALKVDAMGGFSVNPVFPENQNRENNFFDVRVIPGTQQEIAIEVANSGDEDITVEINIITASTNQNGIVEYSTPGLRDETMSWALSDITTIPGLDENREIAVPAGSRVTVPILIDIPEEGFDGIILGSVHALLGITEEERSAAGMIVNRFANVIVIRLEDRGIITETEFILGDIRAELVNHHAAVLVEIRNPLPRLTMGVNANAQVYPVGSNEPILVSQNMNVDFAPNSIFQFTMIDMEGFGLEPGNYIARIQLEHQEERWEFEHEFEIMPQAAAEINEAAVNVGLPTQTQQTGGGNTGSSLFDNSVVVMIVIGVLAILVVAIASFLIVRSMTSKDRGERGSKSRKNDSGMDFSRHLDQGHSEESQRWSLAPPEQPKEQYDRMPRQQEPISQVHPEAEPRLQETYREAPRQPEHHRPPAAPQNNLSELNQPLNEPVDPHEVPHKASLNQYNEEDLAAERERLLEQQLQQREKEELRRFIMEQRQQKKDQE